MNSLLALKDFRKDRELIELTKLKRKLRDEVRLKKALRYNEYQLKELKRIINDYKSERD